MVLGISFLAKPIWNIFYGNSNLELGSIVLGVSIFGALFYNIYMITSMTLQSLNKFKAVYLSTLSGFLTNALLDVPLMLLFNALGLRPYLGAILATCIGYSLSVFIALKILKKNSHISYKSTYKVLFKILLSTIVMIGAVLIVKSIVPLNPNSKLMCILYICLVTVVGAFAYAFTGVKTGLIKDVFKEDYLNKIKKKLTFKK